MRLIRGTCRGESDPRIVREGDKNDAMESG
jgi:hypothetical protein